MSATPTADHQAVRVVLADGRLSRRGRLAAAVVALAALALAGLGSTWAGMPVVITAGAPVLAADPAAPLPLACHGPTSHLAWDATAYSTVELTVVGDRVATPGDRVGCTVDVANTGPSAAVMTISFLPEVRVGQANPDLADDLYFFWSAAGVRGSERVTTVARGDGVVAEVEVARGQVVPVEVGIAMPAQVTDQAREGLSSTQVSFDVTVRLSQSPGSSAATSPPTSTGPSTGPDPSVQSGPGGAGQVRRGHGSHVQAFGSRLPRTGAEIAVVAAAAGCLVLSGTVIALVARRRRDRDDAAAPGGTR